MPVRRRPSRSARWPVAGAVGLGVVLAAAKAFVVRSHDLDALETLAFVAFVVVVTVATGVVISGQSGLVIAGLRSDRPLPIAVPTGLLAVVAALTVALALAGAGLLEAVRIVLATALGEEILFRGVVFGLAARRSGRAAGVVSSATFGAWHVGDALETAAGGGALLAFGVVVGVVVGTGLVAAFVFAPLRRRTGAVYASALAHATLNLSGTLLAGG